MSKTFLLGVVLIVAAGACGASSGSGASPDGGSLDASASSSGSSGAGASSGAGSSSGASSSSGGGAILDAELVDAPSLPPDLSCTLPFGPVDTSTPTTVVGQGGQACNEASLVAAVAKGGTISFACGGPVTITLTSQLNLPTGKNTSR